jgi:hypothetical protein
MVCDSIEQEFSPQPTSPSTSMAQPTTCQPPPNTVQLAPPTPCLPIAYPTFSTFTAPVSRWMRLVLAAHMPCI